MFSGSGDVVKIYHDLKLHLTMPHTQVSFIQEKFDECKNLSEANKLSIYSIY